MGKAADIHFNKNGTRTKLSSEMDILREKIYCDCIDAAKNIVNGKNMYCWSNSKNRFCLEPGNWSDGTSAAYSWVHLDVREFNQDSYLKDYFFVRKNDENNYDKKIIEIKN